MNNKWRMTVKLDKIKFASLIGFISCRYALTVTQDDMREMDELIDIEVPAQEKQYVSSDLVDELLLQMALGQKIPAIKAYRELCDAGLRESKYAVERYWISKPELVAKPYASNATLGDILETAKSNLDVDNFGVRNVK